VAAQRFDPEADRRPIERRQDRLALPACKSCGSANTVVASRMEFFVYLRCPDCDVRLERAEATEER